jgi:hypothetical protein
MWWSRAINLLAAAAACCFFCLSTVAAAKVIVCPRLPGTRELYVQVFDGKPEELVSLMADHGDDRHGYWKLGYVYDEGRSVTVQCVYANEERRDITLKRRVDMCRYRIDSAGATSLRCE